MLISIDPSNGIPIYEQIVRQVKYNVANGALVSGQQVPSVRELAKLLAINPNTIQRAYQLLQSDGVLETVRGRGQHVSAGAKRSCVSQRANLIRQRLGLVVEEALQAGLEPAELRESFESVVRRYLSSLKS
jgi:GntR family transcriptional regulator